MDALTPSQKDLVERNIPLSLHAAAARFRSYHGRLRLEDLISAAQFGLIIAALKYKPSQQDDPQNMRWSHYAMTCMSNTMSDEIKLQSLIRVPRCHLSKIGMANVKASEQRFNNTLLMGGCGRPKNRWLWLDVYRARNIFPEAAIEPEGHTGKEDFVE